MNGDNPSKWTTQIKKKGGPKNKKKIVTYKPFILSEQMQIAHILLLSFTDIKVRLL